MKVDFAIDPNATYKEFFDHIIRGTGWDIASTTDFFNNSDRAATEGVCNIPKAGQFSTKQQYLIRCMSVLIAHENSLIFFENLAYRSYIELRRGSEIVDEIYCFRAGQGGGVTGTQSDSTADAATPTTVARQNYQNGGAPYLFHKPLLATPDQNWEARHRFQPRVGGGDDPLTIVNAANGDEGSFGVWVGGFLGRHEQMAAGC